MAQRLVVVITIVTSADDHSAVHALETELVIHLAESGEALREPDSLSTSRADGIINTVINNNLLLLSLSVESDLAANVIRTIELWHIRRVSSHRQNTHAHLLEVLQLVQITHTEQIHFRAPNATGKPDERAHVLSLQEHRTSVNLGDKSPGTSYATNRVRFNRVRQVADHFSVLQRILELLLVIRELLSHHLLHPLAGNLQRNHAPNSNSYNPMVRHDETRSTTRN